MHKGALKGAFMSQGLSYDAVGSLLRKTSSLGLAEDAEKARRPDSGTSMCP